MTKRFGHSLVGEAGALGVFSSILTIQVVTPSATQWGNQVSADSASSRMSTNDLGLEPANRNRQWSAIPTVAFGVLWTQNLEAFPLPGMGDYHCTVYNSLNSSYARGHRPHKGSVHVLAVPDEEPSRLRAMGTGDKRHPTRM